MEFLSSSHNETTAMNSVRGHQFPGWRPGTGTPIQRSLSVQSLDRHQPPAVPSPSPRDATEKWQSPSQPPMSPIAREPRHTLRMDRQLRHKKDLRTVQSLDKSEQRTSNNLNNNVSTLLGSYGDSAEVKAPLTASYSTGEERITATDDQKDVLMNDVKNTSRSLRHERVPGLDLMQVSYSHRGPPSIRSTNDSTHFKANMW